MSEYHVPAYTEQPKKKGKGCLIAAIITGVLCLLLFGGCLGLAYFGLDQMGEMAKTEIAADPTVTDAVGEVQDVKIEFMASGQANQTPGGSGDILVFRVTGTKGSGTAKIRMNEQTGAVDVLEFVPDE